METLFLIIWGIAVGLTSILIVGAAVVLVIALFLWAGFVASLLSNLFSR